ncbi:FUN14 domain-containing protein 1 isoform X2 [Daphnia magna]|uniref:FUN14 domain-containing protein 1 n=1 Tax=Daphnia magna TaxID=35525 RepID=A0ABQ9ZL46_9CRUS|nr:FUN14 domain-containing protein 1 isoform X2 [Daphnia magna]XP_045036219.1 FUN14 domain-containing protein 1 isoform X2 [Daphnia magna]KAK4013649.1 hypothetical protein OUZ56_026201 [Daphnia magna]
MASRGKPAKKEKLTTNEEFDVLDVRDVGKEAESLLRYAKKYISEGSHSKQLAVGGVSGWITGYIAMKIGKTIATAVGGSLILLQIANHKGYINVNWSKMNKDLDCATKKLTRVGSDPSIPQMLDKVQHFVVENGYFSWGFSGGFLLGLAS